MKVAVVGCGMGGATVAWQLAAGGHDVVVFEQAPACGPVGAGILLQPSGQAVLDRLGVLPEVAPTAAHITGLDAMHRSGRALTTLDYSILSDELEGLGVLRGELFGLLHRECLEAGAQIVESHRVTSYRETAAGVEPITADGTPLGVFDLLVAADGSNSALRQHSAVRSRVRVYPYGAMWTAAPFDGDETRLIQMVDRTGRLAGVLPVGLGRCSFFWGIELEEQATIIAGGIEAWRSQVRAFHPSLGLIVEAVDSFDEVTFSGYRTVRMSSPVHGRVVFIGDAAHATSPHLGQGLNLALVDAATLAEELATPELSGGGLDGRTIAARLDRYADRRRATSRYYTQVTGALTPFFQTSNPVLRGMRNAALPVMPHVPFLRNHMVLTMAGLKESWLRPLAPKRSVSPSGGTRRR